MEGEEFEFEVFFVPVAVGLSFHCLDFVVRAARGVSELRQPSHSQKQHNTAQTSAMQWHALLDGGEGTGHITTL